MEKDLKEVGKRLCKVGMLWCKRDIILYCTNKIIRKIISNRMLLLTWLR